MIHQKLLFFLILLQVVASTNAQESNDYVEFNDRKNVVHGVYLGIAGSYGKIEKKTLIWAA